MASRAIPGPLWLWVLLAAFLFVKPTAAFGAGNIASISKIEGTNWRHGDIEDMLKTVAFLKGKKWSSTMVKRVYFGNWLRDYSQAMDVGTLKSVQAESIRILVWVLSFLSFGYATREFEVTADRLGVYRPEEHIDNPKDYADNQDARQYDPRLRPPVQQIELDIDLRTGMKNYIANEDIGMATSSGYVKYSISRSIHFGRMYTSGASQRGKEEDLWEALRCLGQALHCMEDFGAHTNYTELALREIGYRNVFPHVGASTEIDLHGRRVFPLVTGTFGMVDFVHSVLGEATDHFTQSEVDELNNTLGNAQGSGSSGTKSSGGSSGGTNASALTKLLSQIPGTGDLCKEAERLQAESQAQEQYNQSHGAYRGLETTRAGPDGTSQGNPQQYSGASQNIPGSNIDPVKTAAKIYPILEFRDNIARSINAAIEKIPGLESLVEKIGETITLFILSLLAPFVRPIILAVSKSLKAGSSGVVDASGKHQYEPWTDPRCNDPTHSLLSKDHFSNVLNEPAGQIAATILQYVTPRVLYAWENTGVPVEQVLGDIIRAFHHPAIRDRNCEIHNQMFAVVEKWARSRPHDFHIDQILSSESVRAGKNHKIVDEGEAMHPHGAHMGHGSAGGHAAPGGHSGGHGGGGSSFPSIPGLSDVQGLLNSSAANRFSGGTLGKLSKLGKDFGLKRGDDDLEAEAAHPGQQYYPPQSTYEQGYQQGGYQGGYQAPPPPQNYDQGGYGGGPPPQQYQYGGQQPPPPQGGYGGYGGGAGSNQGYYGGGGY